MNSVPQIVVDGLTHVFDSGKSSLKALDNISLRVEQGGVCIRHRTERRRKRRRC